MDSTFLKATWQAKAAEKLGNKVLFSLGHKSYTQNDFAKYLESQMTLHDNRGNPITTHQWEKCSRVKMNKEGVIVE